MNTISKLLLTGFLALLTGLAINGQPWKKHGKLLVNQENPHYLQYSDGTPFFWLGDTGWEMLRRLSREEIVKYMTDRSAKGFNVIQTVIISEFIHMDKVTNFYGDSIFVNENPESPMKTPGDNPASDLEYDFWDHVDFALETAQKQSLYLGLLPSWGEWVTPRTDKALFNTPEQAYNYGWFLGNRYKSAENIIWILGGDRHPDERKNGPDLWRAMAEGITDGTTGEKKLDGKADYSASLITYHSYNSSSNWFHNDAWIDFHTWGSYHAEIDNPRSIELAQKDWNLPSPKPTLNSEPCYENHGINYAIPDNGYFTSTDVRIAAYWSVFSGCMGFSYGAHAIWQFTDESRKKHSENTTITWQQSLGLPGSTQVGFLKKLMLSRPMTNLSTDRSMLISGQGNCSSYAPVLLGKSHALVYIPTGNIVTLKLGKISGSKIKAWWFNPRTGTGSLIGEFDNSGERSFKVPGMSKDLDWLRSGRGCDWVLVIDDTSAGFIDL
jgi:hypothetical protein